MSISGIGGYDTSAIAGYRSWAKSSPADILADVQKAASDDSTAGGVEDYDFKSMTPKQMKGLADQLFHDGKIDLTQNLMLQTMGVPLGKLGSDGEFVPLSAEETEHYQNTPVNYFQVGRGAMEFLEQSGQANNPQYGYDNWKQIMNVLNQLQGTLKSVDLTA